MGRPPSDPDRLTWREWLMLVGLVLCFLAAAWVDIPT